MYPREFEKLIRQNPPRAVLFYGDNDYLIESYIEYYIKITNSLDLVMKLYYDEYNFNIAKNYLSQSSLFGDINFLLIKRDKKIPKNELETLLDLVKKNSNNYLIFYYQGSTKDIKSMQSLFSPKNSANWVRFFEPNAKESINILQKRAREIGLDIDYFALNYLLTLLNNNLTLCINELDKLNILNRKVTSKDIDNLVYSTAPLAVEKLLIDLFEKKPIVDTLWRVLELGEDEFSILRATQFFLNQIFLFHSFMKLNGYIDSKEILGYKLPKQIEEQKANLALQIKSDTLLELFEHLLDVELEMKKSSSINKELLLYGAFIKLQSYL